MGDCVAAAAAMKIISTNSSMLVASRQILLWMLFSLFLVLPAFAQDQAKTAAGKPLTNEDSLQVKTLFFDAINAKTIENLPNAESLFNRVLQIDPANDAAMYELANLRKIKNDYPGAEQLLQKAVAINKDNKWYWTALADCYEKGNQIDKLEDVFDQLIRLDPDKTDSYFDKANVYYHESRYDDALKVYDQIEQITGPTDDLLADRQKIYLKQGNVDLAAKQMEKMIEQNPGDVKYYLYLSELYTANNLTDKGLKVLQAAEKLDPNNGLVHLALADIYRDKKDPETSYNELTLAFAIPDVDIDQEVKIILGYLPRFPDPNAKASALELSRIVSAAHPDDAKAWAVYGDMLLQSNKLKEAREAYEKAISLNNQVYDVQEQLVRIEIGQNDNDAAIKDGENALSYFPNQAWMNYLVGVAWMQKKDYNKAIGYIKNATSLEMDDKELLSQAYSALGDCYHSTKDYKSSDESYDKSLSYNPDNAFTLNNYAYYLAMRGDQLDKAASMSKHSNDLQPNNASFEDTYAWILFKQHDFAGARTWIEKALADDKTNSAVKSEHYGDIMFYLGNVDAAVENWKKAKANGDQSPLLDKKINERKYVE
jgi:tetratricopeptide (TPR) repeat protein